MKKICGIYKITSPSKKIYIGQSTNINSRLRYYKNLNCKKQIYLYHSLKKYGFDKHKFEIIHECLSEELNDLEIYYIELFQCFNSKYGLNLRTGGKQSNHCSDYTRQKISKILTGKKRTKEQCLAMSHARKGKKPNLSIEERERRKNVKIGTHLSEETKKKISLKHTGKKLSQEHRNNISLCQKGRKLSEEYKKKISISMTGRFVSQETRDKLSKLHKGKKKLYTVWNKGKHLSNETKKKISISKRKNPTY